jgi:hypothetical protein
MARYLSAGTLKELLIRVARKEMTYEEMSSKVQNETNNCRRELERNKREEPIG